MSATDHVRLPDGVNSPNGKLVVLYVQTMDGATVDALGRELGLSKLTLMTVVERLAKRDVLRVDDGEIRMARGS